MNFIDIENNQIPARVLPQLNDIAFVIFPYVNRMQGHVFDDIKA
jgi:hypothetical protein